MWKLTIIQTETKFYKDASGNDIPYEDAVEVSFEAEDAYELLVIIGRLSKLNATKKTNYTLVPVDKGVSSNESL